MRDRAPLTLLTALVLGVSLATLVFTGVEFLSPYAAQRQPIFATALTLGLAIVASGLSSASLNVRFENQTLARRYFLASTPCALLALLITGILFL